MSILLKNGNVVGSQMVSQQNILVENGVIAYLGTVSYTHLDVYKRQLLG